MVSVLTLPTAPIRTAPAARARFVFRAGRAGALGWTISKIVFEAQRVLLHWLDKLSCVRVPKWHNLAGFHFGSLGPAEAAPPAPGKAAPYLVFGRANGPSRYLHTAANEPRRHLARLSRDGVA